MKILKIIKGILRINEKESKTIESFKEEKDYFKGVQIKDNKIKICLTSDNVGFLNEILKKVLSIKKINDSNFENFSFLPIKECSERLKEYLKRINEKYNKKGIFVEICDGRIINILKKAEHSLNKGITEKEILRILGFFFEAPLIGPRDVVLSLSNICNLNCIYCEGQTPLLGQNLNKIKRNMLDFESIKQIISEFYVLGVENVLIIGSGEPTMHPNFMEIFSMIQKLGMRINLYSNGLNLNKKLIEEISKFENWEATFSISASDYETYEKLHPGIKVEDFKRMKENIKYLCSLNPDKIIYILSVVNSLNYDKLEDFVYFAKELSVKKIKLQMVRVDYKIGTDFLKLDEKQLKELPEKVKRVRNIAEKNNIEIRGDLFHELSGLNERGYWSDFSETNPCYAGWMMSFVTEDKKINFCCGRKTVDSIENKSFYKVWNSKTYNDFRIAAKNIDKNFQIPSEPDKKLIDEYCLHCDNLEINEAFKRLLEKSGLKEFLEKQ